jgi:hypothetical protein
VTVRRGRIATAGAVAVALALLAAAAALAATAPAVTTGAASRTSVHGARLNGRINPHGAATTWHFEYGLTTAYSASTPARTVRSRTTGVHVQAAIAGLTPGTRYHFRLVAQNAAGTTAGRDRSFVTKPPPRALTLAATPNPVRFGRAATLQGTLTGAANAGRQVQLLARPFPFAGAFTATGSAVVTNAQGAFAITLPTVAVTTQFRARATSPAVTTPVVTVTVLASVGTRVSRTVVRSGRRVHFSGTVRPAEVNRPLAIQRRRRGQWVTVAGTVTRPRTPSFAVYGKTIRIRHPGLYRIFLGNGSGATAPNVGREIRIHVRR